MTNSGKGGVFFVTGPLHSGKTTRLRQWCKGRTDVGGVFQPVIEGQRYFIDIRTGERRQMDATVGEVQVEEIGKFRFSKKAFDWAAKALIEAIELEPVKYLVVDEVGPLEMQGKGLDVVLTNLLGNPMPGVSIVLVVRDFLLAQVLNRYGVEAAEEFTYPEQ